MKDGVLIGIDAGTSVIKSVAFTTSGEQIAIAAISNVYETLSYGGVEQDMARTWRDTAQTLKQLSEKIPNLASRLVAISVTGQGDGMWLIDEDGEPVAPAWLWLDARAADRHLLPGHIERAAKVVRALGCESAAAETTLGHIVDSTLRAMPGAAQGVT